MKGLYKLLLLTVLASLGSCANTHNRNLEFEEVKTIRNHMLAERKAAIKKCKRYSKKGQEVEYRYQLYRNTLKGFKFNEGVSGKLKKCMISTLKKQPWPDEFLSKDLFDKGNYYNLDGSVQF